MAVLNNLTPQQHRLLRAFAKHEQLAHDQINDTAGDGTNRHAAYVSELNKLLCDALGLDENPIRPLHGHGVYRLSMPEPFRRFVVRLPYISTGKLRVWKPLIAPCQTPP